MDEREPLLVRITGGILMAIAYLVLIVIRMWLAVQAWIARNGDRRGKKGRNALRWFG